MPSATHRPLAADLFTYEQHQQLTPRPWVIENVFRQGWSALLFGDTGVQKTFVALSIALSVATGEPWYGHPVTPGPVLYIDAENGEELATRVTAWDLAHPHVPTANRPITFLKAAVNFGNQPRVEELMDILAAHPHALVVVDTLAANGFSDENSASVMGDLINQSRRIATADHRHASDHQAAVLWLHHTRKDSQYTYRGSSAIGAGVDVIHRLTKQKPTNELRLTTMKQRHIAPGNTMVFANQPIGNSIVLTHLRTEAAPPPSRWTLEQQAFIHVLSGGPMRYGDLVCAYAAYRGKAESTAYKHVGKAKQDKFIVLNEAGLLELADHIAEQAA